MKVLGKVIKFRSIEELDTNKLARLDTYRGLSLAGTPWGTYTMRRTYMCYTA